MPRRSNASPRSGTVARESAVWPPAIALATRSPAPASPANVSLRPPLATASSWTFGEDTPGGRARERGAAGCGGGGGEGRGVRCAGGELGARDVIGGVDAEATGAEHVAELAAQVGVARGNDRGGALLDHLACMRRAGQGRDRAGAHALGHEGRRVVAERRHEALRGDEHRRTVVHARADLAEHGRQARARHREHDDGRRP